MPPTDDTQSNPDVGADDIALRPGPVRRLFEGLNASTVRYVVLRGYLPPSKLEESLDIDVFIPQSDMSKAARVVHEVGWMRRRVQTGRFPHVFFDYVGQAGRFAMMFDVVTGLNYGDRLHELEPSEAVLRESGLQGVVRVPDPWHAYFMLVLHLLLDKDELVPHHYLRAQAHWELCRDSDASGTSLQRDFGKAALDLAVRFAERVEPANANGLAPLRAEARALRCLRSRPLFAATQRFTSRVRQRFREPVRIAVIGLDGAGKTTLIDRFRESAAALPVGTAYLGYNQFQMWWFRVLWKRITLLSESPQSAHGLELRVLDVVREILWPLEIRSRMRRAGGGGRMIVVYDRFPLREIDPPAPPSSLVRRILCRLVTGMHKLIPDPDIVLFLDGDAAVLWPRKKEYPLERFLETQRHYRRVFGKLPYERHVILTDGPLEESIEELIRVLAASQVLRRKLYVDAYSASIDTGR